MAKVNQQRIAEELGLSRTTVSRCFTNHPKINPETRVKVFELAKKLGYHYHAPRNIQAKQPSSANVIAVLIGVDADQAEPVQTATRILEGISQTVAAEHLELEFHYLDPSQFEPKLRTRRILPYSRSSRWRGVLLVYPFQDEAVSVLNRRFPVVSVLEDYSHVEMDCIDTDQVRGITEIVQHLHDLGHRRIGFLTWQYPVPTPWVLRRLGAYFEKLFELNLTYDPDLVLNAHPGESIPLDVLSEEVARRVRRGVTGWVCAADHQAYRLIDDLRKLGVRIPEDCSITGFDGDKPPHGLPQVTTIGIPHREIGVSAVTSLIRNIEHPNAPRRHILVTGEMIRGDTTRRIEPEESPPAARITQHTS